MKKYRIAAALLTVLLLICLCACAAKTGDLETALKTNRWEYHGGGVILFLRPDGTGAQYDKDGYTQKESFRWELSGNVLRFIITEDGEDEDFGTFTVEQLNTYTLRLTEVNDGDYADFYRSDAFD